VLFRSDLRRMKRHFSESYSHTRARGGICQSVRKSLFTDSCVVKSLFLGIEDLKRNI